MSNGLKQLVGNLPTNCLSRFAHFVGLALKGLIRASSSMIVDFHKCVCIFDVLLSTKVSTENKEIDTLNLMTAFGRINTS